MNEKIAFAANQTVHFYIGRLCSDERKPQIGKVIV